jgi:hypothetical protein
VRKKEVLLMVKEQRNILHELSKRKAKWIGHILIETVFYSRLWKKYKRRDRRDRKTRRKT